MSEINGFDVNVIATGSTGNCTILDSFLALDMGVPFISVRRYMRDLRLVFISHEHGDHLNPSTVRMLAKARPTLRFCVGPFLVDRLIAAGVDRRNIDVMEEGKLYAYGPITLEAVKLRHNVDCFGLKVYTKQGRKCLYAVDTGTMEGITAKGFDLYLLEANHRQAELEERAREKMEAGLYAYELAAAQNHLSYEQAMDWLAENMGPNSLWLPMHGHVKRGGEDSGGKANVYPENH